MELHIITKAKAKRLRAAEDFTARKPLTKISLTLTYLQFLKEVANVANVKVHQLDCENMRWRHQKPVSASPTNISEDESYNIMIEAICSKKDADRWIIVEMGKPLLSEAVCFISPPLMHKNTENKLQPWAVSTKQKHNFADEDEDRDGTR